jgi:Major Facilitator Superfamily
MSLGSRQPDTVVTPPENRARQTVTLGLISVAALLVSLTQSLLVPVLPMLTADLRTSSTNVEWLLTSSLLVAAAAVPAAGRLADLYGKKRLLLACLVAFVAGSLLCALTSNPAALIVGRAVTGLSMAAIPLGISLVSAVLPPGRHPRRRHRARHTNNGSVRVGEIGAALDERRSSPHPTGRSSSRSPSGPPSRTRTAGSPAAGVDLAVVLAELRLRDPVGGRVGPMREPRTVLRRIPCAIAEFQACASERDRPFRSAFGRWHRLAKGVSVPKPQNLPRETKL